MKLKLHRIVTRSTVNGPGERAVVWFQGCSLGCAGCFNPTSHLRNGGITQDAADLARQLSALPIRGVTLTGGEPLQQARGVLTLLAELDKSKDVLLFSGLSLQEVLASRTRSEVLSRVDAALLGRYDQDLVHPYLGKQLVLRGSRIAAQELLPHRIVELSVGKATVVRTGFPALDDERPIKAATPPVPEENHP